MGREEVVSKITEAARSLHTINIEYTKKTTGEGVTHEVEPYEIKGDKFYGRRIEFTAPDGIRAFILDNIISVEDTGNPFTPYSDWEVKF